jgi:hypothetical protein
MQPRIHLLGGPLRGLPPAPARHFHALPKIIRRYSSLKNCATNRKLTLTRFHTPENTRIRQFWVD